MAKDGVLFQGTKKRAWCHTCSQVMNYKKRKFPRYWACVGCGRQQGEDKAEREMEQRKFVDKKRWGPLLKHQVNKVDNVQWYGKKAIVEE